MAQHILEKVLRTVRNHGMFSEGDGVLVAVSGGPDSVFLAHALLELKNKLKLKKISVCNLDHSLRGRESREDSIFVKKLAEDLGLECVHKKVVLDKTRLKKLSTEELAREERYKFFRQAAKKTKTTVIATGHTLDDQAETVLMRFVKGASLKGMAGIAPVRCDEDVKFVRPLIDIEKKEIIDYLKLKSLPSRVDGTNLKPLYFRNIVRMEILPFLERYNPGLKRVLSNLAGHLREDFQFILEEKNKAKKKMFGPSCSGSLVRLSDIVVQPRAIQKEVLRDMLERSGGEVKKLSFKHWKEMENLITRKPKGKSVDLPGGVRLSRTENSIVFSRI